MKKLLIFLLLIIVGTAALYPKISDSKEPNLLENNQFINPKLTDVESPIETKNLEPEDQQTVETIRPKSFMIPQTQHVYQTFNNCGPATLSMFLSYYDVRVDQGALGNSLRPYQNPTGDNDDKSVTFIEFVTQAHKFNLNPTYKPAGTPETIKLLVSQNKPVIVRTWLNKKEDIGHFRLVRGYDDNNQYFLVDDSYDGPNKKISYDDFMILWEAFGYEYMYIPNDGQSTNITAGSEDWNRLLDMAASYPYKDFNDAVAYFYLGDYESSIEKFETVQSDLPPRMLWYQTEPVRSYFEVGEYDKVFEITDKVLKNGNRAYSEFYHIRGETYLKLNKPDNAKEEFKKAVEYNKNYQPSIDRLKEMESL
jgi:tetratricopeptide (TPR) repeat protein